MRKGCTRKHCCNVMLPQIPQQLANKMKEEHQQAITDRDDQIEGLEFTHKEEEQAHQKAI